MPDRTFFTLRYAVPGYTFVLIIALVALPELQNVVPQLETLVGAFLAFATVLGGGALGFLISQAWYLIFITSIRGRLGEYRRARKFLRGLYALKCDAEHELFFLDYIHRMSNEKLQTYTQRRYDLMQLCGSTLFSTLVGSILGILIRIHLDGPNSADILMISGFVLLTCAFLARTPRASVRIPSVLVFVIDLSFLIPATLLFLLIPLAGITIYDWWVFLVVLFLVILLFFGLGYAAKQHAISVRVAVREVVNSGKFPVWKALRIFTDDYFDPPES